MGEIDREGVKGSVFCHYYIFKFDYVWKAWSGLSTNQDTIVFIIFEA